MTSAAELRAKLEARRTTDVTRVPICIDRTKAQTITGLEAELEHLQEVHAATLLPEPEESVADAPVAPIDERIKTAETSIVAAWKSAAESTVVVVLTALPPVDASDGGPSYQGLIDRYAEEFDDDVPAGFCADMAAACYVRAETIDGEDLGYTWDELCGLLYHGDWEKVWRGAMLHNRLSPTLDLSRRRPASAPAAQDS